MTIQDVVTPTVVRGKVPPLTLGHRLRMAREYAGVSRAEMCTALGVSENTLTNYERGHTTLRPIYVREWARVTEVDLVWLAGDDFPLLAGRVTGE